MLASLSFYQVNIRVIVMFINMVVKQKANHKKYLKYKIIRGGKQIVGVDWWS